MLTGRWINAAATSERQQQSSISLRTCEHRYETSLKSTNRRTAQDCKTHATATRTVVVLSCFEKSSLEDLHCIIWQTANVISSLLQKFFRLRYFIWAISYSVASRNLKRHLKLHSIKPTLSAQGQCVCRLSFQNRNCTLFHLRKELLLVIKGKQNPKNTFILT